MSEAREWAHVGHRMGKLAAMVAGSSDRFAIIEVTGTAHYVQWHGEADQGLLVEASSGLYDGTTLTSAQRAQLAILGWTAPPPGETANWSKEFAPPADLYAAVRLTVATLRTVYGALPRSLAVETSFT